MDGAPLMMRFDNDHHGRFDAEGGRRPPHHRNSVFKVINRFSMTARSMAPRS
jgi:hypothetical protein